MVRAHTRLRTAQLASLAILVSAPATLPTPLAAAPPEIAAAAAVAIDVFSGRVLYSKNASQRMYPASITKVLTALVVIECGALDKPVLIKKSDTNVEPTSIGFKPGERHTRRKLLHALLIKSANDAALALARDNAGSVAAFAKRMTLRAHSLGATRSRFLNPHGLHETAHYTTAHDLALIARAAMQLPLLRQIVTLADWDWDQPRGGMLSLSNRNRLLQDYDGCTGLKTGFTRAAGQTLCSAALRGADEIVAVVLKTTNSGIWNDSIALLDYGFSQVNPR